MAVPAGLDPSATTVGDLLTAALQECGYVGVGQTPLAEDLFIAQQRLQWMLEEWNRKRWMIPALRDLAFTSTGALTYSVGPGGNYDTGAGTFRPDKIEKAFLRQLIQSQPNQIDYGLELLQSWEDYASIALKSLVSFPGAAFYSPTFPLGTLYVYPVPQASIYAVHILVKEQLPNSFANQAAVVSLSPEYFNAILYNLALRLRSKYQIPTPPDDPLKALAADGMTTIRGGNTAIARLKTPPELGRTGQYNIFSDRVY